MEKLKRKLDRALTVLLVILIVFCLVLCVKLLSGRDVSLFGFRAYHIVTGSMEPTIKTGSTIIVKQVDPASLEKGDIISFVSRDENIYGAVNTHRIIEILTNGDTMVFVTKGDANNAIDSLNVNPADIKGKMVANINLSFFSNFYGFLHTAPGLMTVIVFPLMLASWRFVKNFKSELDEIIKDDGREQQTDDTTE